MGTNFYAKAKKTDLIEVLSTDYPYDDIHIGKSSGGWVFSLRLHPEEWKIKNLHDWKNFLRRPNVTIYDEYKRDVSYEEMMDVITERAWYSNHWKGKTPNQIAFYCSQAGGVPGPNGLIRHNIRGLCVGHGEGTYDYMIGEFF